MTRARFCVGLPALAEAFEGVRREVIRAPRDLGLLAQEIVAMRHKLRQARPVPAGQFDVKHSPGGMVDAEFAVQYLVLGHGGAHPELLDNVGNIALLLRAEQVGLLPVGVGVAAADAYRDLRRVQHHPPQPFSASCQSRSPVQPPVHHSAIERLLQCAALSCSGAQVCQCPGSPHACRCLAHYRPSAMGVGY